MLFWNAGDDSYELELSASAPEDWIVFFNPNNFILNDSTGKELIKLPYQNVYRKAMPVDVIVKPPRSVKPGKYNITVKAESVTPQNGLSLSQERMFNFLVEVENPLYMEGSTQQSAEYKPNDLNQHQVKENRVSEIPNYFYFIIVTVIFLISVLIYKYS
jgi:uncharacterized membrane protein